ncbi:MAG: hypothetical protein JSS02_27655 [Planctomycetes bacterium]|nr:hypothetical protein [Planctomycetota bacterium]
MLEAKHHWMLVGGLFLAAAAGEPTRAENPRLPGLPASMVEPVPAPATGATRPAGVVAPAPAPEAMVEMPYCRPRRVGPLARWHANCKARAQEKYWGYPEEFEDAPLGLMVNSHYSAAIARGQEARMVLWQYDFVAGSSELKPRGRGQLARMTQWLAVNQFPICIEPTPYAPELAEARRQVVWHELSLGPCPVGLDRVVVGLPGGYGLETADALVIDRNRVSQTLSRGAAALGGSGSGSGSGSGTSSSAGGAGSSMSSGSSGR